MQRQIARNCPLPLKWIALVFRGFDSAKRCRSPAQPGVSQPGIVVVQLAPAIAPRPFSGKVIV